MEDKDFAESEIAIRRDEVVRRMANTPPQPKAKSPSPKRKTPTAPDRTKVQTRPSDRF